MTKPVEGVIKTDGLGRMRASAARREQLLDEFEGSGLSGIKFAALVGIKYQTFAGWLQRRRRQRGALPQPKTAAAPASAGAVKWLEAVVEQPAGAGGGPACRLVLHLPGSVRLEIQDAEQAALAAVLVRALAQAC